MPPEAGALEALARHLKLWLGHCLERTCLRRNAIIWQVVICYSCESLLGHDGVELVGVDLAVVVCVGSLDHLMELCFGHCFT